VTVEHSFQVYEKLIVFTLFPSVQTLSCLTVTNRIQGVFYPPGILNR